MNRSEVTYSSPLSARREPARLEADGCDSDPFPAAIPIAYRMAMAALDALDANAVLLDEAGTICVANERWHSFGLANGGGPACGAGHDYLGATRVGAAAGAPGAAELLEALERILSGSEEPFELQYPCDTPMRPRWFVVRLSPFRFDGRIGVLVTHQDVTSRRVARATLDRLEIVARGISSGVLVTDAEARIAWVNEAFTCVTGWPLAEVMGRALADFLTLGETDEPAAKMLCNALENRSTAACPLVCRRPDGSAFWGSLQLDPVFDDVGRFEGFVVLQTDITDQRSAQIENTAAHLEEREHLAGSLHEGLGQELAAAQLMLGALASNSGREPTASLLERASEALRSATRTARTLAYATAPVRYTRGIGAALEALATDAAASGGLAVECRIDPDLAALRGECADVIYRIAKRMMARARSREDGTGVSVVLRRSAAAVELSLRDTGLRDASETTRRELRRLQHIAESAGGYFEAHHGSAEGITVTCSFRNASPT